MSTIIPSLSKNPNPQEIQDFLNNLALNLRKASQSEVQKETDQQGDVLAATATVTDSLINSLFQGISTESLGQVGTYLMSHPEALAVATTAAAGAPPHPISVGVLGLMILVMNSTASSTIAATASANVENFIKANLKNS